MNEYKSKLLRRQEACGYLAERGYPIKQSTLAKYAVVGGGPVYFKFGRYPLYKPAELLSWAERRAGQQRRSTMEVANA